MAAEAPNESATNDRLPHDQRRARRPQGPRRLTRSRDRVLAGVAGGVAAFVGADPRSLRWLFAVAALLTLGIGVLVYGLLWLLLPPPEAGPNR